MLRLRALPLLALFGMASPAVSRAAEADLQEEKVRLEYSGGCGACRSYREHAPLAYFSLGSLAVGGVFYGIHSSLDRSGPVSGNGARMETAVAAAGITALAAGAAYLYYSLRGEAGDSGIPSAGASPHPPAGSGDGDEALSADAPAGPASGLNIAADARGGVAATLVLPLSAILD